MKIAISVMHRIIDCANIATRNIKSAISFGMPRTAQNYHEYDAMNPKRLLIIDDEPGFGEFVRQVALALDYEVTVTTHGQAFQKCYAEVQPTLIILDMIMPDIDGNELLLWALQQGYTSDLIITTGYGADYAQDAKTLAEFMGLRTVTTLVKPITLPQLRAALNRQNPP